jgi:hypothetical protein
VLEEWTYPAETIAGGDESPMNNLEETNFGENLLGTPVNRDHHSRSPMLRLRAWVSDIMLVRY